MTDMRVQRKMESDLLSISNKHLSFIDLQGVFPLFCSPFSGIGVTIVHQLPYRVRT